MSAPSVVTDHQYVHGKQELACVALVRTPDGGTFEFCGRSLEEHGMNEYEILVRG